MRNGRTLVALGVAIALGALAGSATRLLGEEPAPGPTHRPPARRSGHQEASLQPVVIPGGEGFVRSVLAMGSANQDPYPDSFIASVAEQLSHEAAVDLSRRLREYLDLLEELRGLLDDLDRRHGAVAAALGEPGTAAHDKAVELLGWFGLRVNEVDGERSLQRVVGDREARRRQILAHLGVALTMQTRLWADGGTIGIRITDERSALPYGADVWQQQVFGEPVEGAALFRAFVDDERARELLIGVARLDRATRQLLLAEVGLRRLYRDGRVAAGFRRIAPYLRADGVGVVLPGGDPAAWEAILGRWTDTGDLIVRLATRDEGRPAHLWRALALLPEDRARYLLTLDEEDAAVRDRWAVTLASSIHMPDFGDEIRWPDDLAELFVRLPFDPDAGSIAWPGGARVWIAAVRGDDPLDSLTELDRLLNSVTSQPDSGPGADARILRDLISRSDPNRPEPSPIRAVVAVLAAIRYQPPEEMRRAIPLLVRNYRRYGRAYGFLAMPMPLSAGNVEDFVRALRRVDRVAAPEARVEAIRKLQSTLILVQRFLLNGAVPRDERQTLVEELFAIDLHPTLGYGPSFTAWWRQRLVPSVIRGLTERGWPGDDEIVRAALVNGLVGGTEPAPIEVDGIDYRFAPSVIGGRRLQTHVGQQQLPRLDLLLRLDDIAATLADGRWPAARAGPLGDEPQAGSEPAAVAREIEATLDYIEERLPTNVFELDESLPVPVARARMFAVGERLVAQLRGPVDARAPGRGSVPAVGVPPPAGAADRPPIAPPSAGEPGATQRAGEVEASVRDTANVFREALTSYLGDALVGLVYALHMGDPRAFLYQHEHIAWLHQLGPAEIPGNVPEQLYGPWAMTMEGWVNNEGNRLRNSLFGVPASLGRWNLELAMQSGGARGDPVAAETWGEALAYLHYPSLDRETLRRISRRHALGESWIVSAARAGNPDVPPPRYDGAGVAPGLERMLRRLLRPHEVQAVLDAVAAGREAAALEVLPHGNLYLIGRVLDGGETNDTIVARWRLDQAVGMPVGRSGDYLGLGHPPLVPYGEAGDRVADPLLYSRLLDVRVALAVALERQLLPPAMAARLLTDAMARVLSSMRAGITGAWRGMLAATVESVTEQGVRQWVVDLAFADELLLPEDLVAATTGMDTAGGERAAGAPAADTGGHGGLADRRALAPSDLLTLPGADDPQQRPVFGARVDLVLVDVGVWDDGRFVTDLAPEEFTIERDGEPIEPSFVRLEGNPSPSLVLDPLPEEVAERVEPSPRNFVIVADLFTTPPADWDRILLDATDFVRTGIGVRDRAALVTIGQRGDVRVLENFTLDHEAVARGLETLRGDFFGSSSLQGAVGELSRILCDNSTCFDEDPENCRPQSVGRFPNCMTNAADFEQFKLQQAASQLNRLSIQELQKAQMVVQALGQITSMVELGDPLDRPKIVVLLSGGFELRPGDVLYSAVIEYVVEAEELLGNDASSLLSMLRSGRRDLREDLQDLTEALHACHCTMYTIGTLGQATLEASPLTGAFTPVVSTSALRRSTQDPLNSLARDTGGKPFFGSDPSLGFRDVLEDTRLRYVIGFLQPIDELGAEPEWHDLEVRVTRPDLEVRARRGFYWPPRR